MERGSAKHGPHVDEQIKHEIEDAVRAGGPTHAQEFRDPEFPAPEEEEEIRQEVHEVIETFESHKRE